MQKSAEQKKTVENIFPTPLKWGGTIFTYPNKKLQFYSENVKTFSGLHLSINLISQWMNLYLRTDLSAVVLKIIQIDFLNEPKFNPNVF